MNTFYICVDAEVDTDVEIVFCWVLLSADESVVELGVDVGFPVVVLLSADALTCLIAHTPF